MAQVQSNPAPPVKLAPPRGRISQQRLAELANVSRTTVTRALARDSRISEDVTQRILRLAREHGYRPSAAARSIATQRNNCVGVVLCNRSLTHANYGRLVAGVEGATRQAGMRLQLSLCDTREQREDQLPPIFEAVGVDGVILLGDVSQWLLHRLEKWMMPVVLLGSQPSFAGVGQVTGDPLQAGAIMTEHLLSLGHRRIGLLAGPLDRPVHRAYADGFTQAMSASGLSPAAVHNLIVEAGSHDFIAPLDALLQRDPQITAIFCDTDIAAWSAVQFLRARGIRVPEQISVAGAGGGSGQGQWPLTLTSVDVGHEEMARAAVDLLISAINDASVGRKRIVVYPHIVGGETAAHPPAPANAQSGANP